MDNNVEIPKFYKSNKENYSKEVRLWNAGFCTYYDHLGSDITPLVAARMSTGNPSGIDEKKDAGTRGFLWRHGHVSPFEHSFLTVVCQMPISTARQVLRHKSLFVNEYSQRYSEPLHEYFIPELHHICIDDKYNKQGSGDEVNSGLAEDFINDAKSDAIIHKARYNKYRSKGIAKERVRDFQPVSAYTRVILTANLRDWLFFLNKRLKLDAQTEIRELSQAIYSILNDLFPLSCEVFEKYTLKAETFSRDELKIISKLVELFLESPNYNKGDCSLDTFGENFGLNKSEIREFKKKLGLQ